MRYLRLWSSFAKNCLAREMEFRANVIIQLLGNLLQFVVIIVFFRVIYLHTPAIGGWGIYHTLFLVGTNQLINNCYSAFFGLNIPRISEYTREGKLDFILVTPVDAQFLTSLRYVSFSSLVSLVVPLFLIGYAVIEGSMAISITLVLIYLLLLLCGLLVRYSIGFAVMLVSFWTKRAEALHSLYSDFFTLSGYPAVIYPGAMRVFFTFIIPVIVVANFPVMIATRLLSPIYTLYALAISVLFFVVSRTLFKFALRYYSSASS